MFRPDLNGRPVIILSNNDGCVISRSNEAKRIGIKMGQPFYQLKLMIQRYDVAVFSSNYVLYGDMSKRVQMTLQSLVPATEVYSIDESFLDLRGIEHDQLDDLGHHISYVVQRNTGIPIRESHLQRRWPRLPPNCANSTRN